MHFPHSLINILLPSRLTATHTDLCWRDNLQMSCSNATARKELPPSICVCRRPTFSETKRVLYSLLSVFEPSSHALQALNAPAKPAAPKPAKHSPQKAPAAVVEPEPQPVKVPLPLTAFCCMWRWSYQDLAFHHMAMHGTWVEVSA